MTRVVYRPQARLDLKSILHHIAQDNLDAATRVIRQIVAKADLLADSPAMGQAATELTPRLRRFPVGVYLIFYEPTDTGILVERIFHGPRDIEALFPPTNGDIDA